MRNREVRTEALRRPEPQRESNQRKKAGARYGRQGRGYDFEVIFQGLHFEKNILRVILGVKIRSLKKENFWAMTFKPGRISHN